MSVDYLFIATESGDISFILSSPIGVQVLLTFRLFMASLIGVSWLNFSIYYPRDAMLARVLAVIVCLSVRLLFCHKPAQYQNG